MASATSDEKEANCGDTGDTDGGRALRWTPIPIAFPKPGENATFRVEDLALLFCNADGTPYVVRDECPHVATSLEGGAIRGTILECPLHGGQMDLRDGAPVAMPIRRPGVCFPVRASADGYEVGLS